MCSITIDEMCLSNRSLLSLVIPRSTVSFVDDNIVPLTPANLRRDVISKVRVLLLAAVNFDQGITADISAVLSSATVRCGHGGSARTW